MEVDCVQDEREQRVGFFLEAFEPIIRTLMTEIDVKELILSYKLFDEEKKTELSQYADSGKTPMETFTAIIQSIRNLRNKPYKYTALADAFRKIEHENAEKLLTGANLPTNSTHRKVIFECGSYICENMNVCDILPRLYMRGIISDGNREMVDAIHNSKGNWLAAFQLLNCLPNKSKDWYRNFMEVLLETKHDHLAGFINEKFKDRLNSGEDTRTPIDICHETETCCMTDSPSSIGEHVMTDFQEAEPINDLDAPPPIPKRFDSLPDCNYQDMTAAADFNRTEFNIKPETSKSMSDSDPPHNETRTEALVKSCDSSDENTEADDITPREVTGVLKLKDYQLELAENALKGRNTVVCAGTGTGKTWVALHIVKEHLAAAKPGNYEGKPKVVFMARTSALIKQQAERFVRYLPHIEVKLITGEQDESSYINMFLEQNDVLCLTPQILVNNLESGTIKSLSVFSLIILDECHHTKKDEPYNNLMRKYLLEKLVEMRTDLPQVVGLTASIGVGKSHSAEDALDYMLHLFASLDVRILSTVQRCLTTYEQEISHPLEESIVMTERVDDPCRLILINAIEETEDKLQDLTSLIPSMIEMMVDKCPQKKHSLEYIKWTVDLEKKMTLHDIRDKKTARNIVTHAIYLNVYSQALEVNTLLGPNDVYTFLAKKHEGEIERDSHDKLTKEEKELLTSLKNVQKEIRKHYRSENENVRNLCNILKTMLSVDIDDSRAMVFVEARATCVALAKFLANDYKDLNIGVNCLYGKDSRGGEEGMNETMQNETVRKFREGDYKVLVTTSIGVEGIDVPDCNIVLNYNFIGNEITKIQMKGRSRKKDGYNVVIGNEKLLENEKINAYKEAMMQRAMKLFKNLDPKDIERKVSTYQQEELKKFRMRKEIEKLKRSRKSDEGDYKIVCRKCDEFACFTSDIRMTKNQYIVMEKTFKDRVKLQNSKKQKIYDGFHLKQDMHCNNCLSFWGNVTENKGFKCYTLKLESFCFCNTETLMRSHYRKWMDVPKRIPEMQADDLLRMLDEINKEDN